VSYDGLEVDLDRLNCIEHEQAKRFIKFVKLDGSIESSPWLEVFLANWLIGVRATDFIACAITGEFTSWVPETAQTVIAKSDDLSLSCVYVDNVHAAAG
jgi:hypothetical protein